MLGEPPDARTFFLYVSLAPFAPLYQRGGKVKPTPELAPELSQDFNFYSTPTSWLVGKSYFYFFQLPSSHEPKLFSTPNFFLYLNCQLFSTPNFSLDPKRQLFVTPNFFLDPKGLLLLFLTSLLI